MPVTAGGCKPDSPELPNTTGGSELVPQMYLEDPQTLESESSESSGVLPSVLPSELPSKSPCESNNPVELSESHKAVERFESFESPETRLNRFF